MEWAWQWFSMVNLFFYFLNRMCSVMFPPFFRILSSFTKTLSIVFGLFAGNSTNTLILEHVFNWHQWLIIIKNPKEIPTQVFNRVPDFHASGHFKCIMFAGGNLIFWFFERLWVLGRGFFLHLHDWIGNLHFLSLIPDDVFVVLFHF